MLPAMCTQMGPSIFSKLLLENKLLGTLLLGMLPVSLLPSSTVDVGIAAGAAAENTPVMCTDMTCPIGQKTRLASQG